MTTHVHNIIKKNLYPIQERYIRYKNSSEKLVPTLNKLNISDYEVIRKNLNVIIQSEPLLRTYFKQKNENSYYMEVHNNLKITDIPIYKCTCELDFQEKLNIITTKQKSKNLFKTLPYEFAIITLNNDIYLYGCFNHLIYDGDYNFKKQLENINLVKTQENNILNFDNYITSLRNISLQHKILDYTPIKSKLINRYVSKKIINSKLEISSDILFKIRSVTPEELWITLITLGLFKSFEEEDEIPLNILTNGRKYESTIYTKDFGDFHDEIILISSRDDVSVQKILSKYRYYKSNPYLNAEIYNKELLSNNDPKINIHREPFTLVISGKGLESTAHLKTKKLINKNQNEIVLSIKVLIDPNFQNFTIFFRYSELIETNIKTLKEFILKNYENENIFIDFTKRI